MPLHWTVGAFVALHSLVAAAAPPAAPSAAAGVEQYKPRYVADNPLELCDALGENGTTAALEACMGTAKFCSSKEALSRFPEPEGDQCFFSRINPRALNLGGFLLHVSRVGPEEWRAGTVQYCEDVDDDKKTEECIKKRISKFPTLPRRQWYDSKAQEDACHTAASKDNEECVGTFVYCRDKIENILSTHPVSSRYADVYLLGACVQSRILPDVLPKGPDFETVVTEQKESAERVRKQREREAKEEKKAEEEKRKLITTILKRGNGQSKKDQN